MIHAFLEAGGLIFWILTAFLVLIVASEVQNDRMRYATVTVVGYIAAIALFTTAGKTWLPWISQNPRYIAYAALAYLVGAIVWTPIKWRLFFLPKLFEVYDDYKLAWLNAAKLKPEDLTDAKNKADFLRDATRNIGDINIKRKVSYNKARITAWIAYWPFSLMGTFFGDFLTRMAYNVYRGIGSFLQRLSDGMASKYAELES